MATNNRLLSFYTLSLKLKLICHLLFNGHEIYSQASLVKVSLSLNFTINGYRGGMVNSASRTSAIMLLQWGTGKFEMNA